MTNIGLDCGPLAQAWLTSWERRGKNWKNSKRILLKLLEGIGNLKHGIGNNSILLNAETGDIKECSPPTLRVHNFTLDNVVWIPGNIHRGS